MSAAAFISFLAFVFYSIIPFGEMAKIALPFAMTVVAFAVYLAVSKYRFQHVVRHYASCLGVLEVLDCTALKHLTALIGSKPHRGFYSGALEAIIIGRLLNLTYYGDTKQFHKKVFVGIGKRVTRFPVAA